MSCVESSDGERISSPVASVWASRERRRLRLLKLRWSQQQNTTSSSSNGGVQVQSFSAFRRARRMRQQSRMTKEEYLRLKQMVPAVATQVRVSKVQVIEEAIKYIDSLHVALFQRLQQQAAAAATNTSAPTSNQEAEMQEQQQQRDPRTEAANQLMRLWMERNLVPVPSSSSPATTTTSPNPRERSKWPSFLDKVDRMVRKKQS